MNYFSHFVVDHQPHNHEFNTGLLLPDVTKKWIKSFKHLPSGSFTGFQSEILKGCLRHYASDQQFHSSAFFEKHYNLLLDELKQAGLSEQVQRKWFLAHIMLELLIDRVIVKYDRSLLDAFYGSLARVDEPALRDFLHRSGMKDDGEFFAFFNHFRTVRYIYYYTDNNKFLYSLNRIMMRAGLAGPGEDDAGLLMGVLQQFEQREFGNPAQKLKELKAIFE